jgi:hypothetical protein
MNASGLNSSHSRGEPQQEIFQGFVQVFLERRLDLTLETDRFRKIRGDIKYRLNLATWLIQDGEDHAQWF